jgi:conjugal transfer pilus assembly protein TraW
MPSSSRFEKASFWHPWWVLSLMGSMWGACACAESLGRVGNTYPIVEVDARKYFEAEIAKNYKSPKALQAIARKSVTGFLANLPPIPGIGRVDVNRTRYMDLIHVFERDVTDEKGKVLIRAGTRFNLLSGANLDSVLFLLDGRDPRQVTMLQRLWRSNYKVQPILVAGSYAELSQRFQKPFFYDYGGAISARFGVTKVPSVIGQDGNRMRVEELKP